MNIEGVLFDYRTANVSVVRSRGAGHFKQTERSDPGAGTHFGRKLAPDSQPSSLDPLHLRVLFQRPRGLALGVTEENRPEDRFIVGQLKELPCLRIIEDHGPSPTRLLPSPGEAAVSIMFSHAKGQECAA
jgi:hypothetical protein